MDEILQEKEKHRILSQKDLKVTQLEIIERIFFNKAIFLKITTV